MYFSSLQGRKPEAIQLLPILNGRKFTISNWAKTVFYWTLYSINCHLTIAISCKERGFELIPYKVLFGNSEKGIKNLIVIFNKLYSFCAIISIANLFFRSFYYFVYQKGELNAYNKQSSRIKSSK